MTVKIMGEAADCAYGSLLDNDNKYVSKEGNDICEDCWFIEDEEDE